MKPKKINCPECGKPSIWSPENVYRPFCSKRCRMLDLGAWAQGDYQLPSRTDIAEDDYSTANDPSEADTTPTSH